MKTVARWRRRKGTLEPHTYKDRASFQLATEQRTCWKMINIKVDRKHEAEDFSIDDVVPQ